MTADITLLNMNMLYVRYYDSVEKELHVPLGTLYLTRVLEDAGYTVTTSDCGEDALDKMSFGAPDLLILDIRMPGMDGIEVATHLDTLENPPAIVFCTAFDEYALQALQHQVARLGDRREHRRIERVAPTFRREW